MRKRRNTHLWFLIVLLLQTFIHGVCNQWNKSTQDRFSFKRYIEFLFHSRGAKSKIVHFQNKVWNSAQTFPRMSLVRFPKGSQKIGIGQLLQTAHKAMLQLHPVVKESFVVLNKLTEPTVNFMILFYCFCDLKHFGMSWRHIWRRYNVIFSKNVW